MRTRCQHGAKSDATTHQHNLPKTVSIKSGNTWIFNSFECEIRFLIGRYSIHKSMFCNVSVRTRKFITKRIKHDRAKCIPKSMKSRTTRCTEQVMQKRRGGEEARGFIGGVRWRQHSHAVAPARWRIHIYQIGRA